MLMELGNGLKVIGTYPLTNTGSVCIHAIDDDGEMILASINGVDPEWCWMTDEIRDGEPELGFYLGSFFVPLCQVMRV